MTRTSPDQEIEPASLGARLDRHKLENPGAPLLLLKKGLALESAQETALLDLLERILPDVEGPVVLTVLSNAAPGMNPFSGLSGRGAESLDGDLATSLVTLLGPGEIIEWDQWPEHLLLCSAEAVDALAQSGAVMETALRHLRRAGGRLILSDSVFVHDESADLLRREALQPHEKPRPAPWGVLRQRLADWLQDEGGQDPQLPRDGLLDFRAASKPATLHITHSWGGGVAQWVESFITADAAGLNFQLRSEAPQNGQGCGQRLSLYLGNHLRAPIARWWLQPPIGSTAEAHSQYRRILGDIRSRYGISRLIVSSLVGHSIEALATGLPTLQVLHDFYPLWPLLGVHPGPYADGSASSSLDRALEEHHLLPDFRNLDARDWAQMGQRWRDAVTSHGVRVTAPSHSVAKLLGKLDPGWSQLDIHVIPHDLPELAGEGEVLPKSRDDGRLRLVIPGRMQQGKGRDLLLEALPRLTPIAQVYLLGCGKDGEAFFGKPGVDVILQYDRDELRELLISIGPDLAALLSVVPETFSYTLSEMQQLNVPVVATRVGSLAERLLDGETGWLIDPDPESFIDQLQALAADPDRIGLVRANLRNLEPPEAVDMVGRYASLCAPRPVSRNISRWQTLEDVQTAALADQRTELANEVQRLRHLRSELQAEVAKRSDWAEAREQARRQEIRRRKRWVAELEDRLALKDQELQHEQAAHRQTNRQLESLRGVHEWVLSTLSWRLTRPFRVLARILRNLWKARAWNPLRWPLLLSGTVRTVATRGVKGALQRSQQQPSDAAESRTHAEITVEPIGDPEPPAGFAPVDAPVVSVVIPVYEKWIYTAACLRSLAEAHNDTRFEVIVVDDQSGDETPQRLAAVGGLVSLRNERNLGFVGSCNRGAEAARGRYLVLLNNDTQVTDGWLDRLVDTFRRRPDAGIAGARLIYPDGTLQEAGGIIFSDGSGWNYGRGDDADRPDYCYLREADYCSGACIMLTTALFSELGGFDELFAPAYYEDTDLAFRVRASGLKVYVQPAATVVHHEGATSGTDLNSGVKRFQTVNRDKFLARWQEKLQSCPPPISDPGDSAEIRAARDHRLRGRILVIDAYTPEPDQDSGSVRLTHLMNCMLELDYGVTFLADNRSHAGRYTTDLQQAGIEVVYEPWVDSLQRFFDRRGHEFDFVMVSRHYVAANYVNRIRRHCPKARFIFDTVDLHYLREERMAELEDSLPLRRAAAQTRRSELGVINAADATVVVSPMEKSVLAQAAPDARVHVISNVHEVVGSRSAFADRKDIFFVGGYQHPPNVDAAIWFVSHIWPRIHAQIPDMTFHLIGSKAPEKIRALDGDGVRFHGFVKSLDPWLDGCRLAVAPLRYGAGIKGKVNMSMARGQPVVATPMAVEGMFAQSGRDVLIAECEDDFADAVVRLYTDEDLWNRISLGGLENVRQYFSVETARLGLRQLLSSF
jgi:GT2 family glycosyltransferase/glycosyltransferase involved in cell wall biosynthesis